MIPLRDDQIEYFMRKAYQAGDAGVEFVEVVNEMRIWLLQQTQYVRDEQVARYQRYDNLAIKDLNLKPGQVIQVKNIDDFPINPSSEGWINKYNEYMDKPIQSENPDPESFEIGLDIPRQVVVDLNEVEDR